MGGSKLILDSAQVWEAIIAITLSTFAGLAKMMRSIGSKKITLRRVMTELFISAVIGYAALKGAKVAGLTGDGVELVCLAAGWSGDNVLNAIGAKNLAKLGLDDDKRGNEK